MSLHTLPDLEQGSQEWLDARRGIVTASVVGQLITGSTMKPANNIHTRALTAELAAERITGWTDENYTSDDMERGHQDEPRALEVYAAHYAPVQPGGFMVRKEGWGTLGLSPDGLVGDDGLVEVKSRRPKKHLQTILADEVPAENVAQLQCALLVSGRRWVDYVSYCGGMPLFLIRVEPDPAWQEAIVAAVTEFEKAVTHMVARYHEAVTEMPMTERVIEMEMTF